MTASVTERELLDTRALRNLINAVKNYALYHGISLEEAVEELRAALT
jgi:hypothetical protein